MIQADDVPKMPSAETETDAPPMNAGIDHSSKVAEATPGEAAANTAPDLTNEPAQKVNTAKPHAKTGQDTKRAPTQQRPKTKSDKHRNTAQTAAGVTTPDETSNLAGRLLARFELPKATLDRGLVPPELLGALDAAGLGSPDVLPSATFMALAAIIAVAGPHVSFPADDKLKEILPAKGLSLRVVALTEERRSSVVPAALLAGLYGAENAAIDAYLIAVEGSAAQRRASTKLRALHEQATQAAAALGIKPPPPFAEDAPIHGLARPRIVLAHGAHSAIIEAAAGGTGTLVIDDRWMKSMSNVGNNFDEATDALLTALSLGHQIPVPDPDGRNTMRALPASVIGQLTAAECATLHKAGRDQFAGTIFVRAATAPVNADSSGLITLMRRVHGMADVPVALKLSEKARHRLAPAAGNWASLAAAALPPLSDVLAGLPDLARRLAAALHIVAGAGSDGKMTAEIPLSTVKQAATIVDTFVAPVAQALLGSLSTAETERDARRMVRYLREHTSRTNREIERRPWMRAWQKSMPITRFDAALALLQQAKLLTPLDKVEGKVSGGQRFEVAAAVHDAA
ncbi:MAG: hypothetical protein HYX37_07795 [Rhizobiales bacterium]|nr:hypothetical protein [Hyphomicrobiales bacterium]